MAALQKEVEKNIKVQEFRRDANYLLDSSEKEYIQYALKEYTSYRNVSMLMKALLSCLNTPEKLDLLLTIRELLPKTDHREFDRLAPYKEMAHPLTPINRSSRHIQEISITRIRRQPLGFSIRGGKEMGLGIFVSHVDELSPAYNAGMQIGDQIIEVNGINFERISHESAVIVIKAFDHFDIVLSSLGKLPQLESSTEGGMYIWVDPSGKRIDQNGIADNDMEQFDDQLLSSVDKRKVVIRKEHGRVFGLKIRGGKEFRLGIFVVGIDPGSTCEEHGLRVGDQILSVNNTSFRKILHHEAAAILKNNRILIMTIKSVGRIPKLVSPKQASPAMVFNDDEIKYRSLPRNFHSKKEGATPPSFRDKLTESPKFSRKGLGRATSSVTKDTKAISPLVNSQSSPNDVEVVTSDSSPKFEYGIGTQVMLADTVYSPVSQQLLAGAHKCLNQDEVDAMKRKLTEYENGGKLKGLTQFLIAILDTPDKLDLLKDIRPLLKPQDLTKFDKLMSPHEMAAMKEKRRMSEKIDDNVFHPVITVEVHPPPPPSPPPSFVPLPSPPPPPPSQPSPQPSPPLSSHSPISPSPPSSPLPSSPPVNNETASSTPPPPPPPPPTDTDTNDRPSQSDLNHDVKNSYNSVLQDLKGHQGLRKVETIHEEDEEGKEREVEGAFGNPAAKEVLEKAKLLQRDSILQSRDSFLAWNENYTTNGETGGGVTNEEIPPTIKEEEEEQERRPSTIESPGKPMLIDIQKTAFFLGLEVTRNERGSIIISEVMEDGAAFNDGFLQAGFKIIKVDNDDLKGRTEEEAEGILNENYDSDRPTIELIVEAPNS